MSKYYYCSFCEEIIPEEALMAKWDADGHQFYNKDTCPHCGYDELEEAESCKICGAPISPYDEYCDDCLDKAYRIWDEAVCKVMDLTPVGVGYLKTRDRFIEFLDNTGIL